MAQAISSSNPIDSYEVAKSLFSGLINGRSQSSEQKINKSRTKEFLESFLSIFLFLIWHAQFSTTLVTAETPLFVNEVFVSVKSHQTENK